VTTAGTASARFREFGSTGERVVLEKPVKGKLTYPDSRYLGRYNGVYDSPREILCAIIVARWAKKLHNNVIFESGGR
jgi:hypothetical protein